MTDPAIWFGFQVDPIGLFLAGIFALVGLFSIFYSLGTIHQAGHRLEYYLFMVLLVISGIGFGFATNLLLMYILWEVSTISIWRLVGFYREEVHTRAAQYAFLINFAAASLMVAGLALSYIQVGSFDLARLGGVELSWGASLLILLGILAKSATLPLHIWLPQAYGVAPAAVGAALAGITENLGLVLFLRLFILGAVPPAGFLAAAAWLAIASGAVAGGVALLVNKLRSILAYSTISQLSFILLGFAVAGRYGVLGGLLYILAHSLGKSGLFLGMGLVEASTARSRLDELGGLVKRMPTLSVACALLCGSIAGIPPFIGFFSKLGVVMGAVESDNLLGVGAIAIALFTLLYLIRFFSNLFLGSGSDPVEFTPPKSGLVAIVLIFAILSLLAGPLSFLSVRFLGL